MAMNVAIQEGKPGTRGDEPAASTSSSTASRSHLKAEAAMAVGGFGIGTGEFVIMGLLPDVAADTHVAVATAGHAISAYALGVVVGAPLIAVLAARAPRHLLLISLMAWFAAGNVASALAGSFEVLTAFRFLTGLPHGAFFGVAALVAAAAAGPGKRGAAVGRVMLGLTGATVFGVPLATWLGQTLGWQAAFVMVAGLGLASAAAIWKYVPRQPGDRSASPLSELKALRQQQVLVTLGVGSIGLAGLFCVFTYITPLMTEVAGLPKHLMPVVLAVFGVGMMSGNMIGAKLADRFLTQTIVGALVFSIIVIGGLYFTAHNVWLAMVNVLLIGQCVALAPALQIRLMDVAGEAQTLAASLNHSALNVGNALGAWLGGVAITAGWGWTSTGIVGAVLAVLGLAVYLTGIFLERRSNVHRAVRCYEAMATA